MKKMIGIEALLTWAFVEELPKVESGSVGPSAAPSVWQMMFDVITLGTNIDKSPNGYGVVGNFVNIGEPHPDALIVGNAVRALADRNGYEIMSGWWPFPEWDDPHGVIRAEVDRIAAEQVYERGGRLNGRHIVTLVTSAAILKRGPDWTAEQPKVVTVKNGGKDAWFIKRYAKDAFGGTIEYEDNGFHVKRQRPMRGAYRKYRLADPIRSAVIARLEWQLWQSALEALHDSLSGAMAAHDLLPFSPNRQPWAPSRRSAPNAQATENATETAVR
ncbi:hypothetical protein [Rhizobium sp. AB2/73]|uniref:hypothetical protein n=1 Tax=Rhizobium sp. AB2/73 TaxID=2795216 RepID=UPI001C5D0716|nr:hypothetical protein [Rhizobium sp. AB2/73]QYA12949.1 hypothetical protein J5284_01475 [Rhizobium sp. AB2/73]UEQ81118.1 hypothetical protein I8E17_00840 [Rhizobium sp. AB2/73]